MQCSIQVVARKLIEERNILQSPLCTAPSHPLESACVCVCVGGGAGGGERKIIFQSLS